MIIKAFAKVNLSLDIVGKRKDGYHLLKTIMQQVELYDVIDINKSDKGITLTCNKSYLPTDNKNLAYKAAELFLNTYNISSGVTIDIKKFIPVSAGLAGGSTDAAAVLKGIRRLYKPEIKNDKLASLGLKIGADVPYCLTGGTALCEGIGEKVMQLKKFRNKILVIVKPPFGTSTAEVYKKFDLSKLRKHPNTDLLLKCIEKDNMKVLAKNLENVLENVTLNKHTIIKNIKQQMIKDGALGSLMSGSGPTVFAFFDDMLKAQMCYDGMSKKYKDAFITRTI
ncbi:4-(cytidine 5'-diphospho)-2-C-methyl-D-erythritol kinase [Clostridium fermenticellae]|uniref:4-diphosphocytidyl-2-C-methyl-D-erythritol kinase n=1 Tax=Clostridium fermenticellae TaxID=2068654 RepID=A0A386H0J5_9CLOT|nr:4-(cytidine 5'-diphospho)-2-C-methyl-D-erythritol kinase [Clostridium fermenticellae]AYD39174.1 4-(cytidine 5'-diphospho)-2-C-methyl-D-erythritol kinase [Clostridium fermenticellae]